MTLVFSFRGYNVRVCSCLCTLRLFGWICLCVTLHESCIISQASGWSLVVVPSCRLRQGWEGHSNTQTTTNAHCTQNHITAQPLSKACLRGTGPTLSMLNCGVIYVLCQAYELGRG